MKKNFIVLAMIALLAQMPAAIAQVTPTQAPKVMATKQVVKPAAQYYHASFKDCTNSFQVNQESLFYLTLNALTQNSYKILELQSRTGTILFEAQQKQFIITTAKKDYKNSFIKVLPANNDYNFNPDTISKIFTYINVNSANS